jgi:predicted nucleic acid-binding protein
LQANAGFVTSGDRHILSQKSNLQKKYKKLKILTKTEFETMFED